MGNYNNYYRTFIESDTVKQDTHFYGETSF